MVLQQTSDAIKLGVLQSFAAGTSPKTARAGTEDRVEKLTQEQADLTRELDELPPTDVDRRRDLTSRLTLSRRNLAFAGDEMRSMKVRAGNDPAATDRPGDDRDRKPSDPSASMHLNAAALAVLLHRRVRSHEYALERLDRRPADRRHRLAAQQSTFGFVGVGGVDYKLQPWLAVGVTLGTETFTDKLGTSGIRVAQNGFSVAPYVGVRLDPNVFLAGFAGFSHLNYNNTPLPAVSAQFEAWRFIAGGSLTGVWRYGPWRLQPSIDIGYGSENQAATPIGRHGGAGPDRAIRPRVGRSRGRLPHRGADRSWSVEPFVLARANLDFASNNNQVVVGQGALLRGQGSGGAGIGMQILGDGFNVRVDVTYDFDRCERPRHLDRPTAGRLELLTVASGHRTEDPDGGRLVEAGADGDIEPVGIGDASGSARLTRSGFARSIGSRRRASRTPRPGRRRTSRRRAAAGHRRTRHPRRRRRPRSQPACCPGSRRRSAAPGSA